jgi:hypothetical protein
MCNRTMYYGPAGFDPEQMVKADCGKGGKILGNSVGIGGHILFK